MRVHITVTPTVKIYQLLDDKIAFQGLYFGELSK